MGKVRSYQLSAAIVCVVVVAAGVVGGCGGASTAGESPSATTAIAKAEEILGHEPTGLAAQIVERGAVKVANDAAYPPQSYVDEKTGKLAGFDVDVAKRVGALLNLKIEFKNPSWETVSTGLQKNRYDVSIGSMGVSAEGEKKLAFTDPYYYAPAQVFVKKGGTPIASSEDLAGKTVGVAAPTTFYDYLRENSSASIKLYDSDADALSALADGDLDFAVASAVAGEQAISSGLGIEFSGKPLYQDSLAFATKKGESDWLAMLNYAVRTMHEDGSLASASKKWFFGLDLTRKR